MLRFFGCVGWITSKWLIRFFALDRRSWSVQSITISSDSLLRSDLFCLFLISSEKSNTHTVHADMNASTAFKYDTGGKEACDLACWVERVSREVTPRVTRAGAASGLIQNDTHCNQVMILQVNILLIQYLWTLMINPGSSEKIRDI